MMFLLMDDILRRLDNVSQTYNCTFTLQECSQVSCYVTINSSLIVARNLRILTNK